MYLLRGISACIGLISCFTILGCGGSGAKAKTAENTPQVAVKEEAAPKPATPEEEIAALKEAGAGIIKVESADYDATDMAIAQRAISMCLDQVNLAVLNTSIQSSPRVWNRRSVYQRFLEVCTKSAALTRYNEKKREAEREKIKQQETALKEQAEKERATGLAAQKAEEQKAAEVKKGSAAFRVGPFLA